MKIEYMCVRMCVCIVWTDVCLRVGVHITKNIDAGGQKAPHSDTRPLLLLLLLLSHNTVSHTHTHTHTG